MRQNILLNFIVALFAFFTSGVVAQTANFTVDKQSGCAPLPVQFTNTSSGANSYTWNFGDGSQPSTLQNPSKGYNNSGTYTVTLTASNSGSNPNSKQLVITVFKNPTAGFKVSPNPGCSGLPVTVTDTSKAGDGALSSWTWDFKDGVVTTTTVSTINHQYSSQGSYAIFLVVKDINGCTSTKQLAPSLNVTLAPTAAFSGNPTSNCTAPATVVFSNTSTASGTPTYTWRFGDGTTSTASAPSHTYASTGSYTVTLVVNQGGCIDSVVKPNYIVIQKIKPNFSINDSTLCPGQSAVFTETSLPLSSSRVWNFGDGGSSNGTNPSHPYTTAGTYTVTLYATDASGCVDSAKVKVTVFPKATADFTGIPTVGCQVPQLTNFTSTSTNATAFSWTFGNGNSSTDQNPSNTYTTYANFDVKLVVTSANGCKDSITKAGYISIAPVVPDFSANIIEGCRPLLVNFTDLSVSPNSNITSWLWQFNPGAGTSTDKNPSNTFTTEGKFDVVLTVTTTLGCTATLTKTSYIQCGDTPQADFIIVQSPVVCFAQKVQFIGTPGTPAPDNWAYKVTDGGSAGSQSPFYRCDKDTGIFDVTLLIKRFGCPNIVIKQDSLTVHPAQPGFDTIYNCTTPLIVQFNDRSKGTDLYAWDFGDPASGAANTSTLPSPSHTFTALGNYWVKQTVSNSVYGCSAADSTLIRVRDGIARIKKTSLGGCYPFKVQFRDSSQDFSDCFLDWGDGNPVIQLKENFDSTHTYPVKGNYIAKLVVIDRHLCRDTAKINIHVYGPDSAGFNYSPIPAKGCSPLKVTLTNTSKSDSTIVQYKWDWNADGTYDSTSTVGTAITHNFTSAGSSSTYGVGLQVVDKNGCIATRVKNNLITVSNPVASLTIPVSDTLSCKQKPVNLDASASSALAPVTYSWNFGDATNKDTTANKLTHKYAAEATYTIIVTVKDANGCTSTASQSVKIDHPNAAYTYSVVTTYCSYTAVDFKDISTGSSITGWNWDFNDSSKSALQNPSHSYTYAGSYGVNLVVTNKAGCKDSVSLDSIIVVPGATGTFDFSPKSGCNPLTVVFGANSSNALSYIWYYGDGSADSTVASVISHTYYYPGIDTPSVYLVSLLPDSSICYAPIYNTQAITVTNVVNVDVGPVSVTLTDDESYNILSTVTGIVGVPVYSWTPTTGLSCSNCANPVANSVGHSVTYKLTVTDPGQGGCIGFDSIRVDYKVCESKPALPNVFTPNGDGINDVMKITGLCPNDVYHLTIYDRWGLVVFETTKRNEVWDGHTNSGELVPDGVYYYIFDYTKDIARGYVQLVTGKE